MDVPEHLLTIDATVESRPEDLEQARKLAREFHALEARAETLKEELEQIQTRKLELQHRVIPEFFGKLEIDNIGLEDAGVDVMVGPYYKANIAADWDEARRKRAFAALDQLGGGDLIRASVVVTFGRDEFEEAKKLVELLKTRWPLANSHPPRMDMTVPWNSLTAFVREQHEDGVALPLEDLGAVVGRAAKVKKRKR